MSVTGRMVTVSATGGMGESAEGTRPESMRGEELGEGEPLTGLGRIGERGGVSSPLREVVSSCNGW